MIPAIFESTVGVKLSSLERAEATADPVAEGEGVATAEGLVEGALWVATLDVGLTRGVAL